ncbi:MAG TPA: glycosyltransferase family 4 protein [Kofleriaceae bacterium]|nr:glycosyltransferase family 4 protein [Kofleriaceae bacterium]
MSNFPPPVHGVAAFNAALIEELAERGIAHRRFPIGTRGDLRQVARPGVRKTLDDAAAIARLAAALAHARVTGRTPAAIYFTPCQGGAGVLRDLAIACAVRALGGRLIAHVHGCAWLALWQRGGWQARVMEAALRACERTLCLGPTFAARLRGATGLACVGINNGVPAAPRVARPAPGPRIELLFLSNLYRAKGLWIAAEAARALVRRGEAVRLRCAGAWLFDHERAAFEAGFAAELAAGTIELVGFADAARKAELFARAQFFVLPIPGDVEGQPLALLEAMAHGVVPITTTAGGMVDLFPPGCADLASPAYVDPERIAERVIGFVRDPDAYAEAAHRVQAHQRAALTMRRCTDDVVRALVAARGVDSAAAGGGVRGG